MKIGEVLRLVDSLKPNQFEDNLKIKWLSKLDGQIFTELFQTHENSPVESFDGYDEASFDTELLVPYPYAEDIYNYYLQAQIAMENGEMSRYNVAITMYNEAYLSFANFWNRTHMPKAQGRRFLF